MTAIKGLATAALAMALAASAGTAWAKDKLTLAVGQRGNWDTSVAVLGQKAGIFDKHDLDLDLLYTQGGGETQQAVLSGSVDIGVAAGIMGVLGAYSKGAPVRIIGAQTTGANDLFWYVRADSPVKALSDTAGKTMAYSTNGSSTHGIVNALIAENGLSARPTATGSPSATLTQVMSGQIDIGWASPPSALDLLDEGKIRIIAGGSDAKAFKDQTVRLLITHARVLDTKRPVIERFMAAYREAVDWMYTNPGAIKAYAEFVGIPEARARRTRDGFFPRSSIEPDTVVGLERILQDAVTLKYTPAPLTKEQVAELVQIPPRK